MDTLADLIAEGRTREGTALDIESRVTPYSYEKWCTNTWKAANLLSHYGVASLGSLSVVVGPKSDSGPAGVVDTPAPLVAVLGGTLLGATVGATPPRSIETRTVVHPDGWGQRYDLPPGCTQLVYGGPPSEPSVVQFEREAWSENPIEPPESIGPDDEAVRMNGETHTHGAVLVAARAVVDRYDVSEGDEVVLATELDSMGAFVGGVVAPMSVGATVVVPSGCPDDPTVGDEDSLVVTDEDGSNEHERVLTVDSIDV